MEGIHPMRHPLLLVALLAVSGPAAADALDNVLKKEALLRGYTTAEAERRYEEYQRNPQAHVEALNKGLGNLVNNMYQRQAAKQAATSRLWDEMWDAIKFGKDYPVYSAGEGAELKRMLEVQATRTDGGEVLAKRRLVEYAMHIRPYAEFIFPQPDYAYAAAQLRGPAYDAKGDAWSANTLAKLYLLGLGVPKDEGEALALVTRYGHAVGLNKKTIDDDVRCALTRVRMMEEGWGMQKNPQAAAEYLEVTMGRYASHSGVRGLTREALEQRVGR